MQRIPATLAQRRSGENQRAGRVQLESIVPNKHMMKTGVSGGTDAHSADVGFFQISRSTTDDQTSELAANKVKLKVTFAGNCGASCSLQQDRCSPLLAESGFSSLTLRLARLDERKTQTFRLRLSSHRKDCGSQSDPSTKGKKKKEKKNLESFFSL